MSVAAGGAAAATPVQIVLTGGGVWYPCKSMELRWVTRRKSSNSYGREQGKLKSTSTPPLMIPVYVSTKARDINPQQLRELYKSCNHSCHRFPKIDPKDGSVEEVIDINKLRIALSHSSVLVSIFCKNHHIQSDSDATDSLYSEEDASSLSSSNQEKLKRGLGPFGEMLQRVVPVTPSDGKLVGFGRAVSDYGLTASIYDVMVIPSLRRMGIGKLIVKRIVRKLTGRDVYDIAALCSERERLFFKACGFGDDILGSTTMMYAKDCSSLS